ncbi:ABC transporter substrate-binding protein [Gemmatimonadetes bacterium T265]|nr:ABC transporter substrate-binding protein [Gemmatimonadetes bacterium T265]
MLAGRSAAVRAVTAIVLGAGLGAGACGPDRGAATARSGASGRGTVVIATAGDAESLVPPLSVGLTARQVTDLVFEPLAAIEPALNTVGDVGFRPRLAQRWTWTADSLAIAFHLDPRARFHDGTPVRAVDVRFSFDLYRDPAISAAAQTDLAGIDSVATPDSLTAVFWFHRRSPEQFYSAVETLRIMPAGRLRGLEPAALGRSAFASAPIGSGPFRFASRSPGSRIEIVADTAYHLGRPLLDRVVWSVTPDAAAAVARMLTGDADIYEAIRPEQMRTLARRPSLTTISTAGMYSGYLLFNLRDPGATPARPHPVFGDRALRRALAAALDRRTMVRNVFDTLGAVSLGPFTRAQASADTTIVQPVYDPAGAARALDALGWRAGADGVRTRGGRRLSFTLLAPSTSQPRVRYAVLIQEQLRRVGVEVHIEPLESVAYTTRLRDRQFDAAVDARIMEPSARELREDWGTASADAPRGTNSGGYANPAFDAAVDRALAAPTREAAAPWFHRAYQTIVDDAPAVWLFEPRPTLAIARRLRVTDVRPDAWWAGMARWSVAPGAEIARDRAGPGGR